MDLEAFLMDNCPAEIVSEVKAADLQNPGGDDIFFAVENQNPGPVCVLASTLYLAPHMSARANPDVQIGFLTSVATYAGLFPPEAMPIIAAAFQRLPLTDGNAFIYFSALRLNRLDMRERLNGTIVPDWTFAHPRDAGTTTWHYYLYLAALGDANALDALIEKIDTTIDGTNTYALLTDLAELSDPDVTRTLRKYSKDTRVTRGSSGPGATLGELVQILLDRRT